jgi:hypothetical protein
MAAAIMGVHSLGGSHKSYSGTDGLWGTRKEANVFSNDFYQSIMWLGWSPHYVDIGNGKKRQQWHRGDKGSIAKMNKEPLTSFMFNTDICFAYDTSRPVPSNANAKKILSPSQFMKQDACCLWIVPSAAITVEDFERDIGPNGKYKIPFCGVEITCVLDVKVENGRVKKEVKCDNPNPSEECCGDIPKNKLLSDCTPSLHAEHEKIP